MLLPNLPTPTLRPAAGSTPTLAQEAAMARTPAPAPVAIGTFGPSPGRAAREAAEARGESPTDAVAAAVAAATPFSCVDTSRRDRAAKRRDRGAAVSPVAFEGRSPRGEEETTQQETPGAEFARLEAEAAAEARAEALAAAELAADLADEIDDFVFPPDRGEDGELSRRAASPLAFADEDVTVALPTVGFAAAAAAGADMDADEDAGEDADVTVSIPTVGFRPVPITPGGYLDRYRRTPAASTAAAPAGITPAFKALAARAQSPAIAKMAALSASVAAESAAVKSALVEAPRSPVKFTTVPVPAFIARDEEEHADQEEEEHAGQEEEEDFLEAAPSPAAEEVKGARDGGPGSDALAARAAPLPVHRGDRAQRGEAHRDARFREGDVTPLRVCAHDGQGYSRHQGGAHQVRRQGSSDGADGVGGGEGRRRRGGFSGEMPSPPKSAASLPSPAARTPTTGPVAGLSPVDVTTVTAVTAVDAASDKTPVAVPVAADKDDDADVETPPATLPSPMGSIKGSPAVRVPVGHPAHPTASTGLTPALARLGIGSSAAPATPTETKDDQEEEEDEEEEEATPLGVVMTGARVTRGSVARDRHEMRSVDRLHAGVAPRVAGTPASAKRGGDGRETGTGKKKPPSGSSPAGSAAKRSGGAEDADRKSRVSAPPRRRRRRAPPRVRSHPAVFAGPSACPRARTPRRARESRGRIDDDVRRRRGTQTRTRRR